MDVSESVFSFPLSYFVGTFVGFQSTHQQKLRENEPRIANREKRKNTHTKKVQSINTLQQSQYPQIENKIQLVHLNPSNITQKLWIKIA
jgi:hypothetical protein